MTIIVPSPDAQIDFAVSLSGVRQTYLQDALSATVARLRIPDIDVELSTLVPAHSLASLAAHGLRGELVFPVPVVLQANPRLLGYYRLLYGYSQKEFYGAATGLARFKGMEERGIIRPAIKADVPVLAAALCDAGALLVAGIGTSKLSSTLLDDLTLLTLGPQLRGGANVRKGAAGIRTVFNAIHDIVAASAIASTENRIEIRNATGRRVVIAFAPDPDIIIREEMRAGTYREIIAIEVKAGSDFSNIHNRIGEAEKSHQKAKARGYAECWTVVNVDRIDMVMARRESPSSNRFYRISDLVAAAGDDYRDFRDRVVSLTGILSDPEMQ
ncbi:MAG: XcyI family restriction endonuclease [Gemmobacter sp.]